MKDRAIVILGVCVGMFVAVPVIGLAVMVIGATTAATKVACDLMLVILMVTVAIAACAARNAAEDKGDVE